MAKQTIGIGSAANDGTGDTIRDAFDKVNDNTTELYNRVQTRGILSTTLALTNQANAEQYLANVAVGAYFVRFDTTGYSQIRLSAYVSAPSASANNPRLYPQYSINDGGAWVTIGTGLTTNRISLASATIQVTDWITIPEAAIGDFLFRVAQNGGDGAADPSVTVLDIQFR